MLRSWKLTSTRQCEWCTVLVPKYYARWCVLSFGNPKKNRDVLTSVWPTNNGSHNHMTETLQCILLKTPTIRFTTPRFWNMNARIFYANYLDHAIAFGSDQKHSAAPLPVRHNHHSQPAVSEEPNSRLRSMRRSGCASNFSSAEMPDGCVADEAWHGFSSINGQNDVSTI